MSQSGVTLRIGEAARVAGVEVKTIVAWERRYLNGRLPRSRGGHRLVPLEVAEGWRQALREGLSGRAAARRGLELASARSEELTYFQRLYLESWERWTREAPVQEVLPVLLRIVRGETRNRSTERN